VNTNPLVIEPRLLKLAPPRLNPLILRTSPKAIDFLKGKYCYHRTRETILDFSKKGDFSPFIRGNHIRVYTKLSKRFKKLAKNTICRTIRDVYIAPEDLTRIDINSSVDLKAL
jgi:hypothetical protein